MLTCIYAHFPDEEFLMAPLLLVHYEWELCSLRRVSSALASFIAYECFRNRTPRRRCPQSASVRHYRALVRRAPRPPPGCHRLIIDGGCGQRLLFSAVALHSSAVMGSLCSAYLLIDRITCFYLNCTYLNHLPLAPSVGKLGLGNY